MRQEDIINMTELEISVTRNTTLETTLYGLDNYTVYNISIAAVTIGKGPSVTLSQRTEENGMLKLYQFMSSHVVIGGGCLAFVSMFFYSGIFFF